MPSAAAFDLDFALARSSGRDMVRAGTDVDERRRTQVRSLLQLSVGLYVISLALPATLEPLGLGLAMAALGWLGPLASQAGWYGTPFLVAAWIVVGRWSQRTDVPDRATARALRVATPGLGLAIACTTFATLPGYALFMPGTVGVVWRLGPGLYVWILSFVLALVAAILSVIPTRVGVAPGVQPPAP